MGHVGEWTSCGWKAEVFVGQRVLIATLLWEGQGGVSNVAFCARGSGFRQVSGLVVYRPF